MWWAEPMSGRLHTGKDLRKADRERRKHKESYSAGPYVIRSRIIIIIDEMVRVADTIVQKRSTSSFASLLLEFFSKAQYNSLRLCATKLRILLKMIRKRRCSQLLWQPDIR